MKYAGYISPNIVLLDPHLMVGRHEHFTGIIESKLRLIDGLFCLRKGIGIIPRNHLIQRPHHHILIEPAHDVFLICGGGLIKVGGDEAQLWDFAHGEVLRLDGEPFGEGTGIHERLLVEQARFAHEGGQQQQVGFVGGEQPALVLRGFQAEHGVAQPGKF